MEWYIVAAIAFIAGALICGVIAWKMGFNYRKRSAEQQLGYAEEEAKRIINDALKTAESRKKEALIEAKEEIISVFHHLSTCKIRKWLTYLFLHDTIKLC